MSGELIDVFDELGHSAGVRDRASAHDEGWWHQAFHVLVVARRAHGGVAILQRRARTKVAFPDLLDLSATGHLAAGERPVDGVRELREELGVELDPTALHPLGVRRVVDETPEGLNREFCHVFLARDDRALDEYSPDPSEVSAVVELGLDDGLDLFAGRVDRVEVVEARVGADPRRVLVGRDQFVPEAPLGDVGRGTRHGYWLALLTMARRFVDGETRLAI